MRALFSQDHSSRLLNGALQGSLMGRWSSGAAQHGAAGAAASRRCVEPWTIRPRLPRRHGPCPVTRPEPASTGCGWAGGPADDGAGAALDQLDLVARLGVALARAPWLCACVSAIMERAGEIAAGCYRPVDAAAAGRGRQSAACVRKAFHQHDAVRRFSVARRLAGVFTVLHARPGEQSSSR
jgi:hypothetical protein